MHLNAWADADAMAARMDGQQVVWQVHRVGKNGIDCSF